jgi:hypothetical protein
MRSEPAPLTACGSCRRRGRTERAHRGLQNARTRFAQLPQRVLVSLFSEERKTRTPSAHGLNHPQILRRSPFLRQWRMPDNKEARSSVVRSMGYRKAPEAIEWLCRVFGFERHAVYPGPNGTIGHGSSRWAAA